MHLLVPTREQKTQEALARIMVLVLGAEGEFPWTITETKALETIGALANTVLTDLYTCSQDDVATLMVREAAIIGKDPGHDRYRT